MRFNEAVCNSMPPSQAGLQNNNQLQRSSSEIAIHEKADPLTAKKENRLSQDTDSYSSHVGVVRTGNLLIEHNINNNLDKSYPSSSLESLENYEGYYEEAPEQVDSDSDWSEYSEDGNLPAGCRGIVNPNYPGFHHLGPGLLSDTDDTDCELEVEEAPPAKREDEYNNNNNNNNNNSVVVDETVNRYDAQLDKEKQLFYEKPKFNIQNVSSLIECMNYTESGTPVVESSPASAEIYEDEEVEIVQLTTSVKESLQFPEIEELPDSSKSSEAEEIEESGLEEPLDLIREANALTSSSRPGSATSIVKNNNNLVDPSATQLKISEEAKQPAKLDKIDLLASINRRVVEAECHEQRQVHHSSVPDVVAMEPVHEQQRRAAGDEIKLINGEQDGYGDTRKKEKMLRNQARRRQQQCSSGQQRAARQEAKRRAELESGSFDVYNIETAMPKIDMDAIETHLKAAREEERRRRNDREEIRRRLAMGPDADADLRSERGRKPSLQSRLQSGMNLQICFMNETSSDSESAAGQEGVIRSTPQSPNYSSSSSSTASSAANSPSKLAGSAANRPQLLRLPPLRLDTSFTQTPPLDEADFFARQARLQTEARMALAQAKEMAHMQMEVERQKLKQNPITEMVRASLQKIGVTLGEDRRRLTRALLTELNIAQLQVLANDLHARIATLNEALVEGLLRRDDLHMEQDSMLVDVEDLTRYLGAKQESFRKRQFLQMQSLVQPRQQQQQQQQQQQVSRTGRTLALLGRTRLVAGRQLVANLVRK